jgi:hypothetical protein
MPLEAFPRQPSLPEDRRAAGSNQTACPVEIAVQNQPADTRSAVRSPRKATASVTYGELVEEHLRRDRVLRIDVNNAHCPASLGTRGRRAGQGNTATKQGELDKNSKKLHEYMSKFILRI